MTHDDPHQADHAEEGHEAEGGVGDDEGHERSRRAVWKRGEDDERLHRVLELDDERQVDRAEEHEEDTDELFEALRLFFRFAADLEQIARGQARTELLDLGRHRAAYLGREEPGGRKGRDR